MLVLAGFTLLFLAVYACFIGYCYRQWLSAPLFVTAPAPATALRIAVVVPARNEEDNITDCLRHIAAQDYPRESYEVRMMDDGSTDQTFPRATACEQPGFRLICAKVPPQLPNPAPKKRAIAMAISATDASWIICTDADCTMGSQWLSTISNYILATGNRFVAAPVRIVSSATLISKFQALDFLTMQGITVAMVHSRRLNMCNGANLAYARDAFQDVNGFIGVDTIASGDDMLLMQKMAKRFPGEIGFLKSADAIVDTAAVDSWQAFIRQRIRWASKSGHYGSSAMMTVLGMVWLTNLLPLVLLLFCPWYPEAFGMFIVFWLLKFSVEYVFVRSVAAFFRQQYLLPWLFLLQPLHMLYIVVSGFLGKFSSYEWKGRRLR